MARPLRVTRRVIYRNPETNEPVFETTYHSRPAPPVDVGEQLEDLDTELGSYRSYDWATVQMAVATAALTSGLAAVKTAVKTGKPLDARQRYVVGLNLKSWADRAEFVPARDLLAVAHRAWVAAWGAEPPKQARVVA